jgi:hypothetical protein
MNRIVPIIAKYREIATLHSPNLESTEHAPNWNSSYTQLLQLKAMEERAEDLTKKAGLLLVRSFAEVESEIPTLVLAVNLKKAMDLYLEMKDALTQIVKDLPAPNLESKLLSSRKLY